MSRATARCPCVGNPDHTRDVDTLRVRGPGARLGTCILCGADWYQTSGRKPLVRLVAPEVAAAYRVGGLPAVVELVATHGYSVQHGLVDRLLAELSRVRED